MDELFENLEYVLFPAVMVASPLLLSLLVKVRPHPSDTAQPQVQKARKLTGYLTLATILVLGALVFTPAILSRLEVAPIWGWLTCLAFIPLFFFLGLPLLQTKDPGWIPLDQFRDPSRLANLEQGKIGTCVSNWVWVVSGIALIALLLCSATLMSQPSRLFIYPNVFFLLAVPCWFAGGMWMSRTASIEPQSLSQESDDTLLKACIQFRQIREWAIYLFSMSAAGLFAGLALLSATNVELVGWVGGIGGPILGFIGGAFGTWCSFQHAKLNRLVISNEN